MKKILALVALIAVFSFVACNDDEIENSNDGIYIPPVITPVYGYGDLIGTWAYHLNTPYWFNMYFTFYPDSTYKYVCQERDVDSTTFRVDENITGKCLLDGCTGMLYLYNFNAEYINDTICVWPLNHDTAYLDAIFLRVE